PDYVKEEIERLTGYGSSQQSNEDADGYLPYSPKSKQILAYAGDEAKKLGAIKIGTEHVLLGLLREDDILASRILTDLGLSLSKTKQLLMKKMGLSESSLKHRNQTTTTPKNNQQSMTPTLDKLARDLTQSARESKMDPVVGRD